MATISARQSLRRILGLATDPRVLSAPVIIVCAVLSVLIHLAPNGGTVHGSVWIRIIVAVLAYFPGLGTIAIFTLIAKRIQNESVRINLMLSSYFLGGAMRGLVLSISFYALGMSESLNLDFRIPGSAIPFGLAISAATYAVSALEESKARIGSLRAMQAELTDAVSLSAEKNEALRERTISKIEESIQTELNKISSLKNYTSAEELRSLAADVVRPLSHTLAERVPTWQGKTQQSTVIRWRDILRQIRPELSLNPLLLTLLTTATGLTAFIYFFGPALAVLLVICSAVAMYVMTSLLQKAAGWLKNPSSLIGRALIMTLALGLVSVPVGLIDAIVVRESSDPFFMFRAGLILVPIFGWFIALGGAAQSESMRIECDYNEGIQKLSWLRARLNLMNWFEQGELARVLHGPVQSAIHQGIIRLGKDNGSTEAEILHDVHNGIEKALAPELRWEGERKTCQELCAELSFTWADICKIDFAISPNANSALAGDPAAASLCWDIIHESCNNAIQHGKAKWVSVRIADPIDNLIGIDVIDNGSQYEFEKKPGMGSNMFDACTVTWSRERHANQTALRASLPIER